MKTKLFYRLALSLFCSVLCIQANAQTAVGTTFTVAGITYEITVAGTANANSIREVAVKDYTDLNNLTPTIPATTFYGAPYNVTSIGFGAFASNSLVSVTIPSSVTSIEDGAFENNSLTSVAIPSSVTSIGKQAFSRNSLTSITIPSSVTSLGEQAFSGNSTLIEVISESTNPAILISGTFDDNRLIDLTVPTGFDQVYINANWFGFKTINSISYTITQNDIVYQIVDLTNDIVAAFDYIGTSATVSIPATVSNSGSSYDVITIGDGAFENNSLTSITIPSSITSIGDSAFENNSLTSVTIPSFVTTIGASAFNNNYNLTEVISESTNPATLIRYTFFNNNGAIDLTIPANTTTAYTAAGWINFKSVTEICYVNILDANFKAALVADTNINTNGDTEISCTEADVFTGTIDVDHKSISNLVGIEYFVNITGLTCSYNSLTTLNVSANTKLEILQCQNNSLSALNVANGNNTAISLFSSRNNPDLTCIQVSDVAYSNTNFYIDNGVASFSTNCNYCYVTIPDANFKAALVVNTSINTNGDNEITCSEAEAFSGILNVQSLSISDLTGIDAFTNITALFCNNNSLTNLDLSNNTSLIALRCLDNSLTSLNVANGNNLNSVQFNATNNPNLTCIQVDDVTYSTTSWTNIDAIARFSLDCSACNVSIPDANFKAALVANTFLNTDGDTEISCTEATDFTGTIIVYNQGVFDLTGIENFTNITGLNCANNSLSSLDVSANTALTTLGCGFNRLTSLDVSTNLALENLTCMNNRISSLNISENLALVGVICDTNYLSSLNVANGNNTDFTSFSATSNAALTCIQVDDVSYSTTNWTSIDATASFSENCEGGLSVGEFTLNSVSLFPNPTSSVLNIKMNGNLKRAIIYSVLGAKVLETTFKDIAISNLKNGLYLIKIEDQNGSISTKTFIKE